MKRLTCVCGCEEHIVQLENELLAKKLEIERLKVELVAYQGDPEGCQLCGNGEPLSEVPNCDPSVGYHDTLRLCQTCIDEHKHNPPCGSCGS